MKRFVYCLLVSLFLNAVVHADIIEQSFHLDIEQVEALSPAKDTLINKNNVDQYADILAAGIVDLIKQDFFSIQVGETISFLPHSAYIEATRAHLGSTLLGEQPGEINGYIAGRPFPEQPSAEDERAGDKLAWNMRYTYAFDSGHITDFFWHFKDMRKEIVERTLSFYASSLRYKHRHVQQPLPELENNPSGIYNALYLRVLSPPDIRGSQYLVHRLEDDTKKEQAWLYLSSQRRIRRLPTGQNTDAFFGSDIMIEDFLGYNGRIIDQTWTYKDTVWVLLPFFNHNEVPLEKVNDQDDGYKFVSFHGKGGCFPNVTWQLRKVYILEAVPKDPDHPLSRRVFYMDAQTMSPVYGNIYDRAGKLWRIAIVAYAHADSHHPDNHGSGMPIIEAVSMIDIQAMHCTALQFKTMLPDEPFDVLDFTPQALRSKGR